LSVFSCQTKYKTYIEIFSNKSNLVNYPPHSRLTTKNY
jgi:hypothetical protein